MEFFVVLVVVLAVSVWLGLRVYRFFRRASTSPQRATPDCASTCPSCAVGKNGSSCAELADAGKALMTDKTEDRG